MSLPTIGPESFLDLIRQNIPVIDVRAPVEFKAGAIPHSVNLPILNDDERAEIGTIYKLKGQQAAFERGYQLVSGSVKEARVSSWREAIGKNPQTVLTCFRGGQRSQITQKWLLETGIERPRILGGYKAFRQFLTMEMERLSERELCVISGATGSGKSLIIQEIQNLRPTLDLEKMANHRGSAFGGYPEGQPAQAEFENRLAAKMIQLENSEDPRHWVVEDESRLVGRCAQPEKFFQSLRTSPVVMVDESLSSRVQVTFDDYILNSAIGKGPPEEARQIFQSYHRSLQAISKKLGGLRFSEVQKDLQAAELAFEKQDLEPNKVWISKLLEFYYDPLYQHSLERRSPRILFRGSRSEALQWLSNSTTF